MGVLASAHVTERHDGVSIGKAAYYPPQPRPGKNRSGTLKWFPGLNYGFKLSRGY